MKTTVATLAALAVVAVAAPAKDLITGSLSRPKTSASVAPRSEAKLPWKKPGFLSHECGPWGFHEESCGTQRYCDAFDTHLSRTDEKFKSTKECFDAHDPNPAASNATAPKPAKKLPWKELRVPSVWCKIRPPNEEHCGTRIYCNAFDTESWRMDKNFKSAKECFDAHDPKPAASNATAPKPAKKLPWKKPGAYSPDCGPRGYTELHCGTQRYCNAFDTDLSQIDEKFKSTKECFNAHDPNPAASNAIAPKPGRLSWMGRGRRVSPVSA